jgi:hypothetical protein
MEGTAAEKDTAGPQRRSDETAGLLHRFGNLDGFLASGSRLLEVP